MATLALAGCANDATSEKTSSDTTTELSMWRPPTPTSRLEIPRSKLGSAATLGEVDKRLRDSLRASGYDTVSYFQMPGGFAVITPMEQYSATGEPLEGEDRWSCHPPPLRRFSVAECARALILGRIGQFRVLAIAFTEDPAAIDHKTRMSQATLGEWDGALALPAAVATEPCGPEHRLYLFVYEFERRAGAEEAQFKDTGLGAVEHLQKSGILKGLES